VWGVLDSDGIDVVDSNGALDANDAAASDGASFAASPKSCADILAPLEKAECTSEGGARVIIGCTQCFACKPENIKTGPDI
jgi:hypothetical protein